jgi:hypothetical protein
MTEWKLIPIEPIKPQIEAMLLCFPGHHILRGQIVDAYNAAINLAPPHPCDTLTIETARNKQDWKGMDGVTAWHLIDRHADGWSDIGLMMDAWLAANIAPSNADAVR